VDISCGDRHEPILKIKEKRAFAKNLQRRAEFMYKKRG
jgi:hypothetical protein